MAPTLATGTIITAATGLHIRTVASLGQLPSTLPHFGIPQVPFTLQTLWLLLPLALTLAAVGLLETQLTAQIVDDMTDTPSNRSRESAGQGIANIAAAFFGGMGGCAMIGQSVINVSSGGRGRLSTLVSGAFLLVLLVAMQHLLALVPVAALTAVMIMVSINTFSWRSLAQLRTNPKTSSAVMLATVIVVSTGNLSAGVLVGVLMSGIFFASKVSRLSGVNSALSSDGAVQIFHVAGQIFFASAGTLTNDIHVTEPSVRRIVIDLTHAHFWDISAIGALDTVVMKERGRGIEVDVVGLNEASATMVERYDVHDKEGAGALQMAH